MDHASLSQEAQFRNVLRAHPDSPFLRNRLGDHLLGQGQTSSAINEFKRSAQGYLHQGFFKRAIAVLRKAVKHAPMDISMSEFLVAACRLGNRPTLAANTYFGLSEGFLALGDEGAAYQYFVRGVKENPTNLMRTKRLIHWAKSRGDLDRAADLYLQLARQNIHHAEFDRANAHLEKARDLRNGPKLARLYIELFVAKGSLYEARKLLVASLKRFPKHADLIEMEASLRDVGLPPRPEPPVKMPLVPRDHTARLAQAKTWYEHGYSARALSLIQRLLIANPGNFAALSLAETIHRDAGYLSRILRLYFSCAERLVRNQRLPDACYCLDRAEKLICGSTRAIRKILDLPNLAEGQHK